MSSNKKYIDFGIKWGLIMGGTIAVIRNIIWVFDRDAAMGGGSNIIWWISVIAFIIFLSVIGVKARNLTGFITFKQGFTALFFAILVHGVLNFAVSETLTLMNEDEIAEKINEKREEMVEKWEESGMSDEQIETSLGWFDRFSNPSKALIFYFIAGLIINTLIALIIAAIIKRTPPQEIPLEPETT